MSGVSFTDYNYGYVDDHSTMQNPYSNVPNPTSRRKFVDTHELLKKEMFEQTGSAALGDAISQAGDDIFGPTSLPYGQGKEQKKEESSVPGPLSIANEGIIDRFIYFDSDAKNNGASNLAGGVISWPVSVLNQNKPIDNIIQMEIYTFYIPEITQALISRNITSINALRFCCKKCKQPQFWRKAISVFISKWKYNQRGLLTYCSPRTIGLLFLRSLNPLSKFRSLLSNSARLLRRWSFRKIFMITFRWPALILRGFKRLEIMGLRLAGKFLSFRMILLRMWGILMRLLIHQMDSFLRRLLAQFLNSRRLVLLGLILAALALFKGI